MDTEPWGYWTATWTPGINVEVARSTYDTYHIVPRYQPSQNDGRGGKGRFEEEATSSQNKINKSKEIQHRNN